MRHSADGLSAARGPGAGGWVRLHRMLLDHPIWLHLPPAVAKVAIYFLLHANFKPGQWYDGAAAVEIPGGSFVTSLASTATACNLSVQQVRDAFVHLERTQFATYRRTHRWTLVTVLNWATYQASADDTEHAEEHTGENHENRKGTLNKNVRSKEQLPASSEAAVNGFPLDPDELPFVRSLDPQPFPREAVNGNNHSAGKNGNRRAPAISDAIKQTAERIHARHPRARRDIGVEQVGKKLVAIVKHRRVPIQEQQAFLEQLDCTHAAMCASETWSRGGGQYAKGLENWLAPTKERYLAEAPPAAVAQGQPPRMVL